MVIELCFNLLEGSRFVRSCSLYQSLSTNCTQPDIKALQISLTGFLDKDTPKFCKELWSLCLSAQSNPQGVPKELLEAKKLELIQEKVKHSKPVVDSADGARLTLRGLRKTLRVVKIKSRPVSET